MPDIRVVRRTTFLGSIQSMTMVEKCRGLDALAYDKIPASPTKIGPCPTNNHALTLSENGAVVLDKSAHRGARFGARQARPVSSLISKATFKGSLRECLEREAGGYLDNLRLPTGVVDICFGCGLQKCVCGRSPEKPQALFESLAERVAWLLRSCSKWPNTVAEGAD